MGKTSKILLALLLVLVMVFSAACTTSDTDKKDPADDTSNSSTDKGSSSDNDEDVTPGDDDDSDVGDDVNDDDSDAEITVEEKVLYETDDIRVTVTGYDDGWFGPELELLIENNGEVDVIVSTLQVSVGRVMMPSAGLYAEVAAGKKTKESLCFYDSDLEQGGIGALNDIEFYIDISDAETWDTIAISDLVCVSTSAGSLARPSLQGTLIYDANDIKITYTGLEEDDIWGSKLMLQIENNRSAPVEIYMEDASVNGFMAELGLWAELRNGTTLFDGVYIDMEELNLESIEEITEIEFKLNILDGDTWDDIDTSDAITITFE